jgi:hypothetical protein
MGSFQTDDDENVSKGKNAGLRWVQRNIDKYNAACRLRTQAVPFRYKLLACIGISRPYYDWQLNEPLQKYYD